MRHRRSNQWHHALALARSGCAAPVAPSQLDIPARSAVRAQGRTDPRSLCPSLEGQGAGGARLRSVHRREDQHSGPAPHASFAATGAWPSDPRRARIQARGRSGLSGSLGRASGDLVRRLRTQNRDSVVRAPGRAGYGPEAISFGQPGVLGGRQWLLASRPTGR